MHNEVADQREFTRSQLVGDVLVVLQAEELGLSKAMVEESRARLLAWLTPKES
jgi:hypothetical protein